jgi:putative ATPase
MDDLGFGKGYEYPHDHADGLVEQDYLPLAMRGTKYYEPTKRGYEATIKARLDKWRKMLSERRKKQE